MATGTAAAGGVLSAGGQIYGGIQARKAAKKQQRLLDEQANLEMEAAEFDAQQAEKQFEKLMARQRAGAAKSGITLEGAPTLILEATQSDKEESIRNILREGQAKRDLLRSQAANARDLGRDALTGSIINAFGGGLSTASRIKTMSR